MSQNRHYTLGPTGRTDDRRKESFQGVKIEIPPFNICSTSKIANTPFKDKNSHKYTNVNINQQHLSWPPPGRSTIPPWLLVFLPAWRWAGAGPCVPPACSPSATAPCPRRRLAPAISILVSNTQTLTHSHTHTHAHTVKHIHKHVFLFRPSGISKLQAKFFSDQLFDTY